MEQSLPATERVRALWDRARAHGRYVSRRSYEQLERDHDRLVLEKLHAERMLHEVAHEKQQLEDVFVTWVPPGHYYSPYPDLAEFDAKAGDLLSVDRTVQGIDLREEQQLALLDELAPFLVDLPFKADQGPDLRYWYDNPAYSWGDGLVLHAMLRHVRPRRVVEVGSGYSSAMLLDTAEGWLDPGVEVTFIEPYDELLRSLLRPGDADRVTILDTGVQEVDASVFTALGRGDVLFLDTTHVAKAGSDVNHLIFEVLPILAPGVLVHVHDIFHLFEYPAHWVRDRRAWQEAYMLRAYLMHNPLFEIRWYQHLMWLRHRDVLVARVPGIANNPGGNLWLTRTG